MFYSVKGEISKLFYVYKYIVEGKPIYIGMASNGTNRHLQHLLLNPTWTGQLFLRKLKSAIKKKQKIVIRIVYNTNKRRRAEDKEKELIAKYGRINSGGILYNIAAGGDGGDTYNGRIFYHNIECTKESAFVEGEQPKGWLLGRLPRSNGCWYHNLQSGQQRRWVDPADVPTGWVRGYHPDKGNANPDVKGSLFYTHSVTGQRTRSKIPLKGKWKPGRGTSSTDGTYSIYDPKTNQRRFLKHGKPIPKGWVKGVPSTHKGSSKSIQINGMDFISIEAACKHFKTTRYKLLKMKDVHYVPRD